MHLWRWFIFLGSLLPIWVASALSFTFTSIIIERSAGDVAEVRRPHPPGGRRRPRSVQFQTALFEIMFFEPVPLPLVPAVLCAFSATDADSRRVLFTLRRRSRLVAHPHDPIRRC